MTSIKSSDIYLFGSALWKQWVPLLTGGSITGLLGLWERYAHKNVPSIAYWGIVVLFVAIAFYRVWKAQERIIAKLSEKPYDDAQRTHAEHTLRTLTLVDKDILRFILVRHVATGHMLNEASLVNPNLITTQLTKLTREGLIVREVDEVRGAVNYSITDAWRGLFKDLLFPRNEERTPRFRGI